MPINLRTQQTEVGRALQFEGHSNLHSKFQTSQGSIEKLPVNKQTASCFGPEKNAGFIYCIPVNSRKEQSFCFCLLKVFRLTQDVLSIPEQILFLRFKIFISYNECFACLMPMEVRKCVRSPEIGVYERL